MPFHALARSALVHPDVQEPLTVELHGESASRPFKHGRPPRGWRPENFRKIVQPGFDLTYMYGRSFELAFETRGHLIDFNFGEADSVMQTVVSVNVV